MHYYKFNISAWSLSTAHLSLEEEAIYFRLVNFYYDTESPIPLETQSVYRRLRIADKEKIASAILKEFFCLNDDGWHHERCEKELKEYRKTAKKNKINGAKGGRPMAGAACKETQDKPSGLPDQSQNNPNYELITNNYELITNNQVISSVTATKQKRGTRLPGDWVVTRDHVAEARRVKPTLTDQQIKNISDSFRDYWVAKSGAGGSKMDWMATWRNWVRNDKTGGSSGNYRESVSERIHRQAEEVFADIAAREANQRDMDANVAVVRESVGKPRGAN